MKKRERKERKRSISLGIVLFLMVGALSGCAKNAEQGEKNVVQDEKQETEAKETKGSEEVREITDMAGRTVKVPAEIDSVFSPKPTSAIYLYTLVPDKLLGWNYELNDIEKSVILDEYETLPNFGMGDSINYEAVIAEEPEIALNVGTINDAFISECDALSDSLGIPVVAVDGDLMAAPEAYRFMGDVLGAEEEAEKLAAYAEETFEDIAEMNVPEEEKIRIYYGNGEDSLETAPAGSEHAQIIDMIHAVNVADLEIGDGSRVQISAADAILNNPDYASLKAVQEQKVYGTPNAPFSWGDRPISVNRLVGVRWLSGLIYPEYLNYDVDEEVCEFFKLFYHVDLTEKQLEQIYNGEITQSEHF